MAGLFYSGKGIQDIRKVSGDGSAGSVDTYMIYYTDDTVSTYSVKNGENGLAPHIGENGNWWVGTTDLSVPSEPDLSAYATKSQNDAYYLGINAAAQDSYRLGGVAAANYETRLAFSHGLERNGFSITCSITQYEDWMADLRVVAGIKNLLSGTGLLRSDGNSCSYDNSIYLKGGIYWDGNVDMMSTNSGSYYFAGNSPIPDQLDGALWHNSNVNAPTTWGSQIVQNYRDGRMYVRGRNNGSWSAWLTSIDSGNIGSQSVNYANSAGSVAWGNVSGRPTTLSGYGITDTPWTSMGYLTGITSNQVTSALGYTPYNASNPAGYVTASGSVNYATNSFLLNYNSQLTYGASGLNYFNLSNAQGNVANANSTPNNDWWHILRMNHANSNGYYVDIAAALNSSSLMYRRIAGGVANGWYTLWDSNNLTPSNYQLASTAINTSNIGSQNVNSALYLANNYQYVSPVGGSLPSAGSQATGAIKIKLPASRHNSSTMLRMTIKIYQYNTGKSVTFNVGGYNYGSGSWYNVFAEQVSDANPNNFTVRFGDDGVCDCIWIGELNSVWDYPQVFITDVQCGFSNPDEWGTGWNISFVTAFDTVEIIRNSSIAITSNNISSQSVNYASSAGSAGAARYLTGADAHTNGTDGWWRSAGNCGWYNETYATGIYSTESGNVRTYNGASFISNNVTATGQFNGSGAGLTGTASSLNVHSSSYSEYVGNDSTYMRFHWNGQSGQPTWLWGAGSSTDMYVYNPSNFSVNYANSAGSANYSTYLNSSNYIQQRGYQGSWNADFQATPAGSLSYGGDLGANGTNGPGGSWWFEQNFRHTNSSNYWGVQVAWGWEDNANRLATRNVTGGNFGSWVYYLNSSNFNQWAAPASHSHDYATHRGEGTNYIDYSRYVYNDGAYSGSGWVEPSNLGVRYAKYADTVRHNSSSMDDNWQPVIWAPIGNSALNSCASVVINSYSGTLKANLLQGVHVTADGSIGFTGAVTLIDSSSLTHTFTIKNGIITLVT